MSERVRIEEESADKLHRKSWEFWLYGSNLVLDNYYVETRQTRRHNYKTGQTYVRTFSGRTFSEVKLLDEKDVPLTEEIKERALREYVAQLRVVRWSEVKR